MSIEWDKIRKIIESKDNSAIVKAKTEVLDFMEIQADSSMKIGCSLQGSIANTFQSNEIQLDKNKSDLILNFKQELLYSFMQRHGMSIYRDTSGIKNGDAIVIKQKNIVFVYDVINVNIQIYLSVWLNLSTAVRK